MFLTVGEAAELCRVKKSHFYRIVKSGAIPAYSPTKKLLFKRSELLKWIEGCRVMSNDELLSKAHASLAGV